MKQIMNANKIWHDASEEPMVDKTFLLVSPNGNSSLCLWGGKELLSVTLGGGHSVLCKGDKWAYIDDIINLQEEPISEDLEKEISNNWETGYECGIGFNQYADIARHFANWQQQKDNVPVSEDFENAALDWVDEYCFDCDSVGENRAKSAFKAGAKWKEQQMMAKAVDGVCSLELGDVGIVRTLDRVKLNGLHCGDKTKVIIIKNE